jgi:SAM-dependent methyltransferase
MAHRHQQDFFSWVKTIRPDMFTGKRVLDIGSLDINGNTRYLFNGGSYTGIDIGPGRNVDIVCRGHEFKSEELLDVIISGECFEHDEFYPETLKNVARLLRSKGLFLFSCAAPGRGEHGTRRTSPQNAPFVGDYYKNLTASDIRAEIPVDEIFEEYYFKQRLEFPQDLYFWGIKR